MKLSVNDMLNGDAETRTLCYRCKVYLNGVKVEKCIEANEEENYVVHYKCDKKIMTDCFSEPLTERLEGKVEIIDPLKTGTNMKQEIYKSTTHGDIPLSFTARHLMQNLRNAIVKAIESGNYNEGGFRVAECRGDIAKYISTLEQEKSHHGDCEFKAFGKQVTKELKEKGLTRTEDTGIVDMSNAEEETETPLTLNIRLPAIPEGYGLYIIDGILSMQPLQEQQEQQV